MGDPNTEHVPGFLLEEDEVPDCDQYSDIISTYDNILRNGNHDKIYQLDGNQSIDSTDNSIISVDTDNEVDSGPVRVVLVPAQPKPGQPSTLDVGDSDKVQAPSSLPLTLVANFRSAYNTGCFF